MALLGNFNNAFVGFCICAASEFTGISIKSVFLQFYGKISRPAFVTKQRLNRKRSASYIDTATVLFALSSRVQRRHCAEAIVALLSNSDSMHIAQLMFAALQTAALHSTQGTAVNTYRVTFWHRE